MSELLQQALQSASRGISNQAARRSCFPSAVENERFFPKVLVIPSSFSSESEVNEPGKQTWRIHLNAGDVLTFPLLLPEGEVLK